MVDIVRQNELVHTIRHSVKKDWEQWYLLTGCVHWDNPKCERELLKRHLEDAKKKDAGVFSFGDFFCAMQGWGDPRGNKDSIRPEHNTDTYLDSLVETATEWLMPYKDNILLISMGNHESSVLRRKNTNLTKRLGDGIGCESGYFQGWIRFMFQHESGSQRSSIDLKYHHGHGGGGQVSKGMSQAAKRAVHTEAEIMASAHIHYKRATPYTKRTYLNASHVQESKIIWDVVCGTYKDETTNVTGGWAIEKGHDPRPLGGIWLRFYYRNGVKFQFILSEEK